MTSTFETYIESKGIKADKVYTVKEVAGLLDVGMRTVQKYIYEGKKTRKRGIIVLKSYISLGRCEIMGVDLIEYLRKCNGNRYSA